MHGELVLVAGAAAGLVTGTAAALLRRPSAAREALVAIVRRRG